ncbi:ABC transporter substrate-binding protein [Azospirillum picis]|uniref:Branched-chain amino acid transport system substrate-binding protein n=1 Tax=Azospirillum picis TaxID=488438 RepID=A0ABU0MHY2_9PROT|nr:ABC transporter substrate-binding protein [Azospirillum picis]MBP2299292.1 branched-chain amino acid transport system substrate-binding protein [Azospirillum picis]MDQ0533070.1 branched-chain amino acid transport system substrate-binding protein [Azospirillum picis]
MRFADANSEPTGTPSTSRPVTRRRTMARLLGVAALLATTALGGLGIGAAPARAEDEIRIGVIYPLTGAAASTGVELKAAAELAAAIINKEIPAPAGLVAGVGMPHMKGAKIRLVFGDHQGNPQVGATEAERLITSEKVAALAGAYFSNVTATASQVAERYGVPFLNGESSSATLTQRHFKWFFRTTPHDDLFVTNFFTFLEDMEKKTGDKLRTVGLFNENTLWGNETTKLQVKLAADRKFDIAEKIVYPAKTTQMTSEVQRLKASKPAVIMQSSYLGDAILSMKTYKELGFLPKMLLANDAGFNDSEFLKTMGKDGEFVISREVWALDQADRNPLIRQVNDLMKQRSGVDFNGNSARAFTAIAVLADAIDRAGATTPDAIRKALQETDIPATGLIMPWKGVKFDADGQNELGQGLIVQVQNGQYATVWPFDVATKPVVYPMPAWDGR